MLWLSFEAVVGLCLIELEILFVLPCLTRPPHSRNVFPTPLCSTSVLKESTDGSACRRAHGGGGPRNVSPESATFAPGGAPLNVSPLEVLTVRWPGLRPSHLTVRQLFQGGYVEGRASRCTSDEFWRYVSGTATSVSPSTSRPVR